MRRRVFAKTFVVVAQQQTRQAAVRGPALQKFPSSICTGDKHTSRLARNIERPLSPCICKRRRSQRASRRTGGVSYPWREIACPSWLPEADKSTLYEALQARASTTPRNHHPPAASHYEPCKVDIATPATSRRDLPHHPGRSHPGARPKAGVPSAASQSWASLCRVRRTQSLANTMRRFLCWRGHPRFPRTPATR
jgi:hypothetical protein